MSETPRVRAAMQNEPAALVVLCLPDVRCTHEQMVRCGASGAGAERSRQQLPDLDAWPAQPSSFCAILSVGMPTPN